MTIKEKLDIIKYNIEKSVEKSGRDIKSVTLLPVSKKKSVAEIRELLSLGVNKIGENYVQEFLPKYEELKDEVEEFHFIGHLQSNKVKYIADKVSLIHSVDSLSLMKEIDKQAKKHNKILDILLEINYTAESSKTGADIKEMTAMLENARFFENIKVKGLMTMPPATFGGYELRKTFSSFNELFMKEKAVNYGSNVQLKELSMGMSNDYTIAIEEGATIVRIGTALFGQRIY